VTERGHDDTDDIDREMAEEGWERVQAKISKTPRAVFGVRLSPEEMEAFSAAAQARHVTLAEFLRSSAWAAIAGTLNTDLALALATVREKSQEISAAIGGAIGLEPEEELWTLRNVLMKRLPKDQAEDVWRLAAIAHIADVEHDYQTIVGGDTPAGTLRSLEQYAKAHASPDVTRFILLVKHLSASRPLLAGSTS
jgi:hypothetical protein